MADSLFTSNGFMGWNENLLIYWSYNSTHQEELDVLFYLAFNEPKQIEAYTNFEENVLALNNYAKKIFNEKTLENHILPWIYLSHSLHEVYLKSHIIIYSNNFNPIKSRSHQTYLSLDLKNFFRVLSQLQVESRVLRYLSTNYSSNKNKIYTTTSMLIRHSNLPPNTDPTTYKLLNEYLTSNLDKDDLIEKVFKDVWIVPDYWSLKHHVQLNDQETYIQVNPEFLLDLLLAYPTLEKKLTPKWARHLVRNY